MIGKLLSSEFLKIKGKGFWFLTFLGPFGVAALQMINYGLRKEILLQQSENDWVYFIENINNFTPLALVLGIVILTSLMASVENETHAWKQLISLPVSKMSVYLAKFTVLASLLFLSSVFLMVMTLAYGIYLEFGEPIPYMELLRYSFYPYFAALPILALQLWLATRFQDQGIPITIGVFGVILTFLAVLLPDWIIWKWPSLSNQWHRPMIDVLLGIGIGFLFYVLGMVDFTRRDVK